MANNNIVWFLEKGAYYYRMQTIWDKKRLIGSSTLTLGDFNLGEIDTYTKKPQGLLLNIGANSYDGPRQPSSHSTHASPYEREYSLPQY